VYHPEVFYFLNYVNSDARPVGLGFGPRPQNEVLALPLKIVPPCLSQIGEGDGLHVCLKVCKAIYLEKLLML